jgi:hypothetical protein
LHGFDMNRFSNKRHLSTAVLAAIAALLVLGLPAAAGASPGAVIQDCVEDGDLDGSYSNQDKQAAANNLPADVAEYSDCADVIKGAITSARASGAGGAGGGTAAGGSAAPAAKKSKPSKKKSAKKKTTKATRKRKDVLAAAPGGSGNDGLFQTAKASDGMPTPLLLALILGAALCAAGGFVLLRKRRPELGQAVLSRVPLRRFRR